MKKIIIISIITILIFTLTFLLLQNKKIETNPKLISASEWENMRINNIDNNNYIILDVRTPKEFNLDGIKNAINIDYYSSTFKKDLKKLDKSKTYLIYCRSGNRSGKASIIMKKLGFSNIYDLDGGMIEYSKLKH